MIVNTNISKLLQFTICFDTCGNLYFDGDVHTYDNYFSTKPNLLFQINIDNKNMMVAESGNYDIIESVNKLKSFHVTDVRNDDDGYDNDNLYPEDDYVSVVNDDDDDNSEFNFYNNDNNNVIPQIHTRINGDVAALYDTYIYDGDNLIFRAKSQDNTSIYVIKIILNECIMFRINCGTEIIYKLKIDELGNLLFI